jgi:hypothetical protein
VTSGCLRTLIGISCEQQQLDGELWRFVVCCEVVLKEKKRSLSRQTSVLGCFKSSSDIHASPLVLILIYLLTANELTPGGSSTVHIYTQTVYRTTQLTTYRTTQLRTNLEECGPCPVFASYTLAFALTTEGKARKNLSQGHWR